MRSPGKSSSSLRQRRSKSPLPSHKHGEESPFLIEEVSSSKEEDDLKKEKNTTDSPSSSYEIALRIVLVIVLPVLAALAYWFVIFAGIYDPDSDCQIPTFDYPDCSSSLMHVEEVAPPLTFSEWLTLRESYHQAVIAGGNGAASSLADDWRENNTVGFIDTTILEIRTAAGKGRAIFATKSIPKGTKIWDSRYRAVFPNACSAKHFFANLTNQQKCDALFWGYINNFYGNGIQYMLDLDGHGYINHDESKPNCRHHFDGELDKDQYALSRLGIPSWGIHPVSREQWASRNRPGAYGLYAVRDIEAGEELLYDYNEIFMYGWVDWFTIFIERSLPIWDWLTI